MTCLVIKQYSFSVATGVAKGKIRFDVINGYLAQQLLFAKGLERKMTSFVLVSLNLAPDLAQKIADAQVESRGIYCFYSKELVEVEALAAIIGSRSWQATEP